MNARDIQSRKTPAETRFETPHPVGSRTPKVSIWDKLSDLSIDTFADKIKLIIIFTIVGLGTILVGDLLKLIPLRGTGIAFQIMGWIIISIGFLIPFFKALDEHS
jgi:hypothetical protein